MSVLDPYLDNNKWIEEHLHSFELFGYVNAEKLQQDFHIYEYVYEKNHVTGEVCKISRMQFLLNIKSIVRSKDFEDTMNLIELFEFL